MTRSTFGPPDSHGLPLLLRPVPYGCATVFLFTVLGVFLGPLLLRPAPAGPDEAGGLWIISAWGMGGFLGLVAGLIASPLVGAIYARRAGPPPGPGR
jgi:hypothetical protein